MAQQEEKQRLRVTAKRPKPLADLGIIDITNFNTAFDIDIFQQFNDAPATLKEKIQFIPEGIVPSPSPSPEPEEPATGLELIYDSNIHGKWNNGVFRKGKKDGNVDANGLGIYTAASGNPTFEIDGKGVCYLLTEAGDDGNSHGRFYTAVCNYNGVFETDFNMMTDTITSYTQKFRSRHQADNWASGAKKIPCEERFGGIGNGFDTASVDMKTERCHNIHDNEDKITGKLPKRLKYGEWYTSRFTYMDMEFKISEDKTKIGIYQKSEIKYPNEDKFIVVAEGIHKHPLDFYLDKPKFMERSELWNRINGYGKLAVRNQKLWAVA